MTERDVWALLKRYGIVPAPAYRLGWSRLSCIACIFGGADQWATLRHIAPTMFEQPGLARAAMQSAWTEPVRVSPHAWHLPAGAFGASLGPS